jgi:hypothetical protein
LQYLKYAVIPIILGVILISCEKDDNTVIDPILTIPHINSVLVSPNSFDTISIKAVLVADVSSDEPISEVKAQVTNPYNSILTNVTLKDDGVLPDTAAGDGHYSGFLNITLDCKLVGSYKVEFVAKNMSGITSSTIANFSVTNINNHKPSVNYVIAPDSLRLPSGTGGDSVNVAFLQMWPTDPDGVCDVSQAYFYSFKPSGQPGNNGNAIPLYDDGNEELHCDSIAYDGKFSVCIKIVNNPLTPGYIPPETGNYRFKYFAKDLGLLESDSLTKLINIHP